MTDNKRFVPISVEWTDGFVQDHYDDKDLFSINELCDLLNELNDENDELKKGLNRLKDDAQYYKTKSANLETGYLDYQNKLEPFYNLARDYNMRITDLSEAFDDLLEENNNLTSQIKKYETTLISSIQSERTSLGGNVLKNLADNLDIEY